MIDLLVLASTLADAAPLQLEHQVRLVTASGQPVNGPADVVVSLWTATTDGTEVFAESFPGTPTADGYASFVLGAGTTPLDDGLFVTSPSLWLQTSVNGVPLLPRERLVGVPYAARAGNVVIGGAARFDATGAVRVGPAALVSGSPPCGSGQAGLLQWTEGKGLQVCNGAEWKTLLGNRVGTSSASAAISCRQLKIDFPSTPSGKYWIDPDDGGSRPPFEVWCDMDTAPGGWTLVAIATSAAQPPINLAYTPTDAVSGDYTKPLTGGSGTRSRFECGSTGTGVIGYQRHEGTWSWPSTYISASFNAPYEENVTWRADVPGWNSPEAGDPWGNHVNGGHYPNFGHTGFHLVDGLTFRSGFTCDPQNSAYGSNDTAWATYSGTRWFRYWLL